MVAVSVTVTAGISTLTATAADAATPHQIGVAPKVPHGAVQTGAPAGNTTLHLDVELAPRNSAALNAFVQAVSDPKSTQYKHYLAKGQFANVFGPTQATIDSVTSALRADGLNPGTPSPDGLTIPVTTTVAQASSALGTGFANYRLPDGRNTFANTAAPSLPASVASNVVGIVGMDNLVQPKAANTKRKLGSASAAKPATPNAVLPSPHSSAPTMCAGLKNALAGAGAVDGQQYWEPGSISPATGYNTAALYNGYGNTGQNVTVALFELENYDPIDISQYQQCWGTNVPVTPIRVDGGPTIAPSPTNGVGFESALDIAAVAGMAPGASILVYQGPDTATTYQNVLDTYQRMVTDDIAQVLSTSWGVCEPALLQQSPGVIPAENNIFAAAAAQGQTTVASSGDQGSTDCWNHYTPAASQVAVDDPASQPYVTAVGGTSVAPNGGAADILSTWHNPQVKDSAGNTISNEDGSGGGVSQSWSLSGSGNYQQSVQGAGYSNACSAAAGATCRQVPDVSALADETRGYLIGYGRDAQGAEVWYSGGGTSLAAPLWAAIAALADSGLACSANGNAGFMNPALYANPGALNDVTTGNNNVIQSTYTGGLYVAGTGYDLTTGLGSIKAPQVVEALCGARGAAPGSDYVPVTPQRIMDTNPVGPASFAKLQITNAHGVPANNVTAVVLNVTAVSPTASSYLTVYPDGTALPGSSSLNFSAGQTIPNLVTVQVGSNGFVDFFNHAGSVHVLADLEGYYTTDTTVAGASTYKPVTPTRLLNATPIGGNSHIVLQVTGQGGVPTTGVTGVILNVTATVPTQNTYLSVYPDGTALPVVSNLNVTPGDTIPNLVTVPVGANGAVDIYNHVGTTYVLADVEGYYTGDGSGLKFHASAPHRVLDTRSGNGVAAGQVAPIGGNGTLGLPVNDVDGPGNLGPIATSGGVVLNVVVTAPTSTSYLKVFPSSAGSPTVSNLNFSAGQTIPNAVVTPVSGDFINFYNHVGSVHAVVDLFGYFATS